MAPRIESAEERADRELRRAKSRGDRAHRRVRCTSCGGDRERNEACGHCGYEPGMGPGFADEEGDY